MAISKIKKIDIIGLQADKQEILSSLQRLSIVELKEAEASQLDLVSHQPSQGIDFLEIEEAITCLADFQEKTGFLQSMVRFKPEVPDRQLQDIVDNFDYRSLIANVFKLRNHSRELERHKEKLLQERRDLSAWKNLSLPLDEIRSSRHCGIILGALNNRDYADLLEECETSCGDVFVEIVDDDKTNTYVFILYMLDEFERIESILKKYRFNFTTLSRHKGTVKDRLYEINREIMVADDHMQETHKDIACLAKEQFKLMVVYDYLLNSSKIKVADKNLAKQKYTFNLSGWIRLRDVKFAQKMLQAKFQEMMIFISEPEGEEAPVDLDNNFIFQPFEFITKIYGLPKYNELDPTPYLAPFFFLYFGLCVSDVGYGLLIILLCWFALKKFRMGPQGKRFFKLFLLCGVSTVVIGALLGGWFGNLLDIASENNKAMLSFKKFKDSLMLLDPLKDPTKLLAIALSLGVIQVWFGNIVAAIGNIKNRRYLDILLDQVTMLTLLFGLTGLGLIFLRLTPDTHAAIFKNAALIGSLGIVATQGRSEKGLGGKIFFGFFTLYNALSGYLSDILSYSRLWALGLVTGVMANTINLISIQFSQILLSLMPFINKVAFIKILFSSIILMVIFTLGHIVSFFMNLLGAFVHPVRLQFVEFFSKFFKGGGRCFKPFKIETKYINIG